MSGRILVAGAAGLIGTHLASALIEQGADVRATTYRNVMQRSFPSADVIQADLRNPFDCFRACKGIDTVYLCAAYTSGAAEIRGNPLSHVTPNVLINTLMLEAAHKAGVRKFVFVSSTVVYPEGNAPVREEWARGGDPAPVYFAAGHMKRYAELLCETYATRVDPPMQCVVVRPSNVYGPHDKFDFAKCHVVPALIRRVVERHDPLTVWGDGYDVRDLLYVEDCVEGMLLAAQTTEPFLAVNLAANGYTVRDVLETLLDIEGFRPEVIYDHSKPSTIRSRVVDCSKAHRVLGFEPRIGLREGLTRTIEWYRQNPVPQYGVSPAVAAQQADRQLLAALKAGDDELKAHERNALVM